MATLVIVGIVVAVVVVAGVAVAAAIVLSGGGIGGGGAGGGGGINIAQATSLQFDVEARDASGNMVTSGTCYMKNIGQSNAKIRMDMTAQGTQVKIIIDAASQKFWLWSGETGWMDMSGYMNPDVYESMAQGYRSSLSNWGGTGEYTYTSSEGHSVRIYNIHVNPALSDSLFTPS
ncbi:MAG: hypothetical protein QW567_02245 [Candidatus Hadarchaeales archaeon]